MSASSISMWHVFADPNATFVPDANISKAAPDSDIITMLSREYTACNLEKCLPIYVCRAIWGNSIYNAPKCVWFSKQCLSFPIDPPAALLATYCLQLLLPLLQVSVPPPGPFYGSKLTTSHAP